MFETAKVVSKLLNVSYIDYPQYIWERGGDLLKLYYENQQVDALLSDPIVYLGNRQAVASLTSFAQGKSASMVMLRDPRDCLVSMYYSFLGSHASPRYATDSVRREQLSRAEKTVFKPDIDHYVLSMAEVYKSQLTDILRFADKTSRNTFIKYEDCIHNKSRLIQWIYTGLHDPALKGPVASGTTNRRCAVSYVPSGLHPLLLKIIAITQNRIPRSEKPQKHIRVAVPGDHVKKLKKGTISKLDHTFGDILNTWYQRSA
jgi:hypothetical protein